MHGNLSEEWLDPWDPEHELEEERRFLEETWPPKWRGDQRLWLARREALERRTRPRSTTEE